MAISKPMSTKKASSDLPNPSTPNNKSEYKSTAFSIPSEPKSVPIPSGNQPHTKQQ